VGAFFTRPLLKLLNEVIFVYLRQYSACTLLAEVGWTGWSPAKRCRLRCAMASVRPSWTTACWHRVTPALIRGTSNVRPRSPRCG